MYASCVYYFLPYTIILFPFLSEYTEYGVTDRTQTIVEENFRTPYPADYEGYHPATDLDVLDITAFTFFIEKTVCFSSIENESVLRDEDIIASAEWTEKCVQAGLATGYTDEELADLAPTEAMMTDLFNYYDTDSNGEVDYNEVRAFV